MNLRTCASVVSCLALFAVLFHEEARGSQDSYDIQEFTQRLDHFTAGDARTFQQRYFIDSEFATDQTSPVIFYICGEGNCVDGALDPATGFAPVLAKNSGAYLVALEHRYYGATQPFDLMTADNLQYLSVEQAIEDLVAFQRWVMSTWKISGKWVAIGASYAADNAAIYRLKHPELAAGAIASSACAVFTKGSIAMDKAAAQSAGTACVAKYRSQVLLPIQLAMGNAAAMAPIKQEFDSSDIPDDLDFLGALTGMAIFDIQLSGSTDFCAALDADQPMTSFSTHLVGFLKALGTRMIDWSYTGGLDPDSSLYEGVIGFRPWVYQGCTEEGVYSYTVQMANPDTTLSLSSTLTDGLPEKYCGVYFGITTPPDIDGMNAKYYQPLLDPKVSNILFVNGSADPACFPFAIAQENGNATNPNTVSYTVEGGTHCQELLQAPAAGDSASLQGARSLEITLAGKWLKP